MNDKIDVELNKAIDNANKQITKGYRITNRFIRSNIKAVLDNPKLRSEFIKMYS